MIKHLLKVALTAAVTATVLTSCTVSEPEMPSGDASKMKLTAITSMGVTIMTVGYDRSDRIESINYANEYKVEFAYGTSTSTVPETVTVSQFEEYYGDGDKCELRLSEQDVWTNIQANASGFITYFDCKNTRWHEVYDDVSNTYVRQPEIEQSTESFDYDAAGHLIMDMVRSVDAEGKPQIDVTTYTWQNNLLMSYSDNDIKHHESATYEYSDVDNIHGQWDPNTRFGPIMISGLFGNAPAKFMNKETYSYHDSESDYSESETTQFSYALTDNGMIKYAKILDSSGDVSMVMNYVYTLKK